MITFLDLMMSEIALAIERQYLSDAKNLMAIETEKEKMKANLLRAVSHDLRTPLLKIKNIYLKRKRII